MLGMRLEFVNLFWLGFGVVSSQFPIFIAGCRFGFEVEYGQSLIQALANQAQLE